MTPVVVPWRSHPDRIPAWQWLARRWDAAGYRIILGTCPAGPWLKGVAVADGMSRVTDVAVIADADVWCDGIGRAVAAVHGGAAWAVPHARILRLDPTATAQVLAGEQMHPALPLERPPHRAVSGGGLVVMRRDVFDACPMPVMGRREDEHWQAHLVRQFGRPWRGTADLYHLYHEPAGRSDG